MKIRVFQSDKGDCLLYTGKDGKRIMIDGGMAKSYRDHVSKHLENLKIDLLCVSHIDQDHIQGILEMMKNIVKWRVYEYQKQQNNTKFKKPKTPKPPEVLSVWHNAFNDQVSENDGRIEDMLASTSTVLASSNLTMSDYMLSKREAIILSNRLNPKQLGIPLNKEFNERLIFYDKNNSKVNIGTSKLSIVGPFKEDLEKLKKEWNIWLLQSSKVISRLRKKAEEDSNLLGNSDELLNMFMLKELGDRGKVSTPNLASIMFLVEEDGNTALFTGDGHSEDILRGLKANKKLNNKGGLHVSVLKIQHHGSEHNIEASFCKSITADHYVFCGNGAHENPDLEAVKVIIDSRLGGKDNKSANQEVDNSFKLWFNSSSTNTHGEESVHMKKLKTYVEKRARGSNGKMKYFFMPKNRHSFEIKL